MYIHTLYAQLKRFQETFVKMGKTPYSNVLPVFRETDGDSRPLRETFNHLPRMWRLSTIAQRRLRVKVNGRVMPSPVGPAIEYDP